MTGGAKRGSPPTGSSKSQRGPEIWVKSCNKSSKLSKKRNVGLHALYSVLSLQNQMGQEIGNELDEQNDITDDLANLVRGTDNTLHTETRL